MYLETVSKVNWNSGLLFCRSFLLPLVKMGMTLALFQLTGASPSCRDLSEVVESSLVMVLTGSFTPPQVDPVRVPGVEPCMSQGTAAKKVLSAHLLSLGLLPHRESVPTFAFFC